MADNNPGAANPPVKDEVKDEELDAGIDAELVPEADSTANNADAMNLDGASDARPATTAVNGVDAEPAAPALESRIPAKKDASLREFIGKMDEYAPIVSDYSLRAS
jgi:transcription initiation factor TFIID subunit 10